MHRYLKHFVQDDLKEKMVFLGGPRQVGKTTFALDLLKAATRDDPAYWNWDIPAKRKLLLQGVLPGNLTTKSGSLLVMDEIHKYRAWKGLIKGLYDQYGDRAQFLVTGSARLDIYRRGGDSLQGRYHYYRLHPLTLGEVTHYGTSSNSTVNDLLIFGGFPEPFLKADSRHWRRWQQERVTRLVREDLRDLENVRELTLLETLADLLPSRVGSPLSVDALRKDLEVSHESIRKWLDIFERLYYCYRIAPYGVSRVKAVKKENKLYLWDWSAVTEAGFRFENMVASHLLKYCHLLEDTEGFRMELCFLRDVERREVDFVVLKDRKPLFAVECKTGERELSRAIRYFAPRTPIPKFFQVHLGKTDLLHRLEGKDARILPFSTWIKELALP